jgi:hypothetical protein
MLRRYPDGAFALPRPELPERGRLFSGRRADVDRLRERLAAI